LTKLYYPNTKVEVILKVCPKCNAEFVQAKSFEYGKGRYFVYCPACRKKPRDKYAVCLNCGKPLKPDRNCHIPFCDNDFCQIDYNLRFYHENFLKFNGVNLKETEVNHI
jgi:hypothetical protein